MARHLPVSTLAGQLDETDTRLWRFISHYVDEARGLEDHTGVEAIGVDGTSRKGRNCITVVAGLCFASMFVRQVRQCFSAVWADGFPRCRHRFPVM